MSLWRWKWLIAALVLVAVLVLVANAYRDSIGRKIVNSALEDTDYEAGKLSVESLSASHVSLSELVLSRNDGTYIALQGITLPVDIRDRRIERLEIDSIQFEPASDPVDPPSYAELLQTGLEAHRMFPDVTIEIGVAELPWLPPLTDVTWKTRSDSHAIRLDVDLLTVAADVARREDGNYDISARISTVDDTEVFIFRGETSSELSGTAVRGDAAVELEYWLPALHGLGAVPIEVSRLRGHVDGSVSLAVPQEPTAQVELGGFVSSEGGLMLTYVDDEAVLLELELQGDAPAAVLFRYPSLQWRASAEHADLGLRTGDREIDLLLRDLVCESGVRCELIVSYAADALDAGAWKVEKLTAVAPLEITTEKTTMLRSRGAATVELSGVHVGSYVVDQARISGDLLAHGPDIHIDMGLTADAMRGRAAVRHNFDTGSGALRLTDATIPFAERQASRLFRGWVHDWDILSGELRAEATVDWQTAATDSAIEASATISLDDLAGHYDELVFRGQKTRLQASLDDRGRLTTPPFNVGIELFDIGIPVENISASLVADLSANSVEVSDLRMELLGGEVVAAPFGFSPVAERNELVLEARGIQLQLMVDVARSSGIVVDGSVSGLLPVAISPDAVSVTGGRLDSDPPGGAIRLDSGVLGEQDDGSQLGFVANALSNFQYDALSSDVSYSEEGDFRMQMRIEGVNPDMDPDQPVVLNLGADTNVPQLLRSLRAGRSISDILGRKIAD